MNWKNEGREGGRKEGRTEGRQEGRQAGRKEEEGRKDGRKEGRQGGRKGGREGGTFFCRPHPPKVLGTSWFFTIFMWNRALARVSCAFCRPHLPKVIWTPHFLRFLCETELSRQSRPHFADPIFQKDSKRSIFYGLYVKPNFHYSPVHFLSVPSSKNVLIFFCNDIFRKPSSRYNFVHFFVDRFCTSKPETAETKILLRRPRKRLHPRKRRVSRPRHDDMMIWLIWRWKC